VPEPAKPQRLTPQILYHIGDLPQPFLYIQRSVHPEGWQMEEPHRHAYYQLVFVCFGSCTLEAGPSFRLETAQTALIPPGLAHAWRNEGAAPLDLLNIHVPPAAAASEEIGAYLRTVHGDPSSVGISPPLKPLLAIVGRISDEIQVGDYGYKYVLTGLLLQIVIPVLRAAIKSRINGGVVADRMPRVERAMWFVECNYGRDLTLADIGQALGVSPKHACDVFRRFLDTTPKQYLKTVRVEKAKLLLQGTGLQVKEIAHLVGFHDEHYFCRVFRRQTGASARDFRKTLR
jgi:AraC-like DNA-binding protein/mannose-6-phosphate isomerase-like protein (cupin superfamily)